MKIQDVVKKIDGLIVIGLCFLIIGLPFSNSIIEIAASAVIALWFFKKAFILRSFKLENTPLNWPILFYLVFAMLSLVNTHFFMTSMKGFAFKTMEHFLLFFVIVETVKSQGDVRKIIFAIFLSCILIGIDGLWQYVTGYDFLRRYPVWSSGRITASFKYPNGFGGWLIAVIPLCISLTLFGTKEKLWKIAGGISSFLLITCLILNFTVGAWLAIIPAVIFLAWKRGDIAKKILLSILLVAILGIGIVTLSGDKEFILRYIDKGHSILHRIELAELCWRMFIDHPLFGHGINTFMSVFESYADPTVFGMSGVSYAHNCYLQIAVETGIFSLLAFLWMIIAFFVSSLRDITRREEGLIKVAQIGFLAGLLAYLTHSALETNLYSLQLAILFYYFLGVAVGIQKIYHKDHT